MNSAPVTSRRAGLSLVASLGVISTTGLSLGTKATEPVPQATTPGVASTLSDEELSAMILGRWQTESHGTRIIHNHADSTASMDVTFDFVASLLYGSKMKLQLSWSIEKGRLRYTIESGTPKASVDSMTSTYGTQATYDFKSISAKQMHLVRVSDPDESYIWTRVE